MRLTRIGAAVVLQLGLLACSDPSTNVPGTSLFIEAGDGKYHGPMMSIEVEPGTAELEVSVAQDYKATGVFEDGTRVDITTDVYWAVTEEALLDTSAGFVDGALHVVARAEGTTDVTIQIGELHGSAAVTVIPAALTEIAVDVDDTTLTRDSVTAFTLTGTYRDGHTADVTADATWTSSNEAILAPVDGGWKAAHVGMASLTATIEDLSTTVDFTVVCAYPADAPRLIQPYETLPYLRWETAIDENGDTQVFDLEEIMCDEAWSDVHTLGIIVSTEWCPYCPDRMRWMNRQQAELEALGMKLVYVEVQDRSGRWTMTSEKAANYIDTIIPGGVGYRLGDLDAMPTSNIFNNSNGFIEAFPTVFVVRTRDMKIIANAMDAESPFIDLQGMAANPEWNWRDPDNPIESFVSNCGAQPDESYEPNDTAAQASEIGATVVQGGICAEGPDYYKINLTGRYRVTLTFEHEVGDLDVYVWNDFQSAPVQLNGEDVGGYSTNNNESFEWEGPALIRIEGKRNDSAPYTLYVESI